MSTSDFEKIDMISVGDSEQECELGTVSDAEQECELQTVSEYAQVCVSFNIISADKKWNAHSLNIREELLSIIVCLKLYPRYNSLLSNNYPGINCNVA